MKTASVILACLLLVLALRPYAGGGACHESLRLEASACHAEEGRHQCCRADQAEEEEPSEEAPCNDNCSCYCCAPLIIQVATVAPLHFPPGTDQENHRLPIVHSYEFTPSIWQPPRPGRTLL